jgi:hypothetical protein
VRDQSAPVAWEEARLSVGYCHSICPVELFQVNFWPLAAGGVPTTVKPAIFVWLGDPGPVAGDAGEVAAAPPFACASSLS